MRRPCGTFDTSYGQDLAIARTRFQIIMSIVSAVLFFCVMPFIVSSDILSKVNIIAITIIAAIGLNILTGYCGQLNFGHAAFVAVGAYISAMLINHLHWSWWATLPFAAFGTALIGLIFGLPSLRIKGFYIAVTTLAAFYIIMFIILRGGNVTGGIYGLKVGSINFFGIPIDDEKKFFFLIAGFLVVMTFFAKNIVRGRVGRAFIAVRDNDLAAELMGIDIFKYKLIAFAVCSAYAGVAGSLFAAYYSYVSVDQFTFRESIWYIGFIIVGGMGSITGTFFGVIFLKVLDFVVTSAAPGLSTALPILGSQMISSVMLIMFGVVIILFLIFEPRGLYHRWELLKASVRFWPLTY
jgi:branched-chain amino acid transport system permease protein